MESGYTVTKRGPNGQAQEIRCATHTGCTWTTVSAGARSDQDPVFVAQFAHHLRVASEPERQAFGHLRRSRAKDKPR